MGLLLSEEKISFKFPWPTSTVDLSLLSNVWMDDLIDWPPANESESIEMRNSCWEFGRTGKENMFMNTIFVA